MHLVVLNLFQLASCPKRQNEWLPRTAVLERDDTMMEVLTIDISADQQAWIDHRLAEGRHIDAAEFLRDLIRHDQDEFFGAVK